jgi:hypothetical protein
MSKTLSFLLPEKAMRHAYDEDGGILGGVFEETPYLPAGRHHQEAPLVSVEVIQASRIRQIADGIKSHIVATLEGHQLSLKDGIAVMRLVNDDLNFMREEGLRLHLALTMSDMVMVSILNPQS